MGSNRNPLTRDEVIAAAIVCIERHGVTKTSMIDVARELRVTRQTVHRLFETRAALFSAVAEQRIEVVGESLSRIFADFEDLRDALVRGSLISLEVGGMDTVLSDIQQQGDHVVDQYMFRGSPKVQAVMESLWGPFLDTARRRGEVREGIDNPHAVEWIRNVHAMLLMRDDYDEGERTRVLENFLIPSLMKA